MRVQSLPSEVDSIPWSSSSPAPSSSSSPSAHPSTTKKSSVYTKHLTSLQLGLAAYRERAKDQWKAHQFFRMTQQASDGSSSHGSELINARMTERTQSCLSACLQQSLFSFQEWGAYLWIWVHAIWLTDSSTDSIHSLSGLKQRSDRRTTRLVWTLVILGLIYWYWFSR